MDKTVNCKMFAIRNISKILDSVLDEYGNKLSLIEDDFFIDIIVRFVVNYILHETEVIFIPVDSIYSQTDAIEDVGYVVDTLEGMSINYLHKDYGFMFDEIQYEETFKDNNIKYCIILTVSEYFKRFIRDLFVNFVSEKGAIYND